MTAAATMPVGWIAGWMMILLGFISGAIIGMRFHRDDFAGGYTSLRRRMLRLGHIALSEIGVMNVLLALSPAILGIDPASRAFVSATILLILGGVSMSIVCFLTAWREPMRRLFVFPVGALVGSVILILMGSL